MTIVDSVSPGGVIELEEDGEVTYQDVINVTCREKQLGSYYAPQHMWKIHILICGYLDIFSLLIYGLFIYLLSVDRFAGWVLESRLDDTVNVTIRVEMRAVRDLLSVSGHVCHHQPLSLLHCRGPNTGGGGG